MGAIVKRSTGDARSLRVWRTARLAPRQEYYHCHQNHSTAKRGPSFCWSRTFRAEWRTGTAVALANEMYETRDFGAMPILADALQDAGCDSEDVLNHCRHPGTHVRGCWVVDLVLGKT